MRGGNEVRLSEMINHSESSGFLKANQSYCVGKDYGLVGVGAGVRMKGRLDGVYSSSPQQKMMLA